MSAEEILNELAKEQHNLGMQIVQILSNAKKDSASRKSETYIDNRTAAIEKIWKQIQDRNEEIMKYGIPEHAYFSKNYFQQLKEKYEEAKNYLKNCPKATTVQPPPDQTSTNAIQDQRLKKQNFKLQQLEGDLNQIEFELVEEKSKSRYQLQLEKVKKQWSAIQDLHEEIMISEDLYQDEYFTKNPYNEMQQQYENITEKLTIKIQENALTPVPQIMVNQQHQHLAIPKIPIPTFHGGYENWSSFYDLFRRVIHESHVLTKAEKMQYLKTHVRGEASKLIQHLEAIEANYDSAWELLQKRFKNKRLLIFKLLDKLLDLPTVPEENAMKLKQLYGVTSECLQALKNLEIETDTWGPMVIRIIIRKWDPQTNRLYEQSLRAPHDVPDFNEFMNFLERRFQSLESVSTTETKYSQSKYSYCHDQNHMTYHCQKFKAISPQERGKWVQEKHICQNCLRHNVQKKCFSQTKCNICSRQHHTLLHVDRNQQNQ